MLKKIKNIIIGAPKNIADPTIFHHISLIPFLAWVGLGADGLSSSAYGPEETFKMLGSHQHISVLLALATIITISVISFAYSRIIEHFPYGGGGYMIASTLLSPWAGVVSGSALIIDYLFTISVSISAAVDSILSFMPPYLHEFKLIIAIVLVVGLTLLNLRGVKESIMVLVPIFILFLIAHIILIAGSLFLKMDAFPQIVEEVKTGFRTDMATIGFSGILAIFLSAYSRGSGTYTGIEAVSNGLAIMREPKVETGKRTMLYMSTSLALTAAGIILAYLLFHVQGTHGQTMNATLSYSFINALGLNNTISGTSFVFAILFSEATLLVVAAQAGFIDGPRVIANMAIDSWLPRRFAYLSDRLNTQDGILFMSFFAIAILIYTKGDTSHLVLMYAISVFITFTLSEIAMIRFWFKDRAKHPKWKRNISVHIIGFILCSTILMVNLIEKFSIGGWLTLVLVFSLAGVCTLIKLHYNSLKVDISRLDNILKAIPSIATGDTSAVKLNPREPTAVILVSNYGGLGIHSLLTIQRLFPRYFKNYIFIAVGVIDSAIFKDLDAVEEVRTHTEDMLKSYVDLSRRLGLPADYRFSVSVDMIDEGEKICTALVKEYPTSIIFAGKIVFQKETFYHRFLHNNAAYRLQRRLQFLGLNMMVLPIRVTTS